MGGRHLLGAALAFFVAACDPVVVPPADPANDPVISAPPPRPEPAVFVAPGPESEELRVYYRRLEADYVVRGLLRTDGGGPDTPFLPRQLAENFVQIALFDEYSIDGDRLVARTTEARLRKWTRPIRIGMEFSDSVSPQQRATDRADVARYGARLARLTGLSITTGSDAPNFHVLVLNEQDRRGSAQRLRELAPGISSAGLREVINLPRSFLCVVLAFPDRESSTYVRAIAIVRDEHPPLLRTSCFHEEIAQGLGLANDSPGARPSIFNDDEEFGFLTTHDELLLRMLYNPAMEPGMTVDEAAPVARRLARELLGQD